jgi:hypothetical protein
VFTSTKSFGLSGAFLVLYISVASATPTLVSPNVPALLRRVPPGGHLCGGAHWIRRECSPGISLQTWKDVCETQLPNNGPIITSSVFSSCPFRNVCSNIVDQDGDRSIKCVNVLKAGTSQTRTKPTDPAIGATVVQDAPVSISTADIDITVPNDMQASVSAIVLSRFLTIHHYH